MKILSFVIMWCILLLSCFAYVKKVAIGKVILVISDKHGWGVHSGDLVVFIPIILFGIMTWVYFKSYGT